MKIKFLMLLFLNSIIYHFVLEEELIISLIHFKGFVTYNHVLMISYVILFLIEFSFILKQKLIP